MEKYKILWIDDDVMSPELMMECEALAEKGCVITPVSNPDQLQINNIPSYNCIIIDLFMPTGSLSISETHGGSRTGFVLLKKILNKHPNSKTKIVVYSVFDAPDVRAYCTENGIEYWSKSYYTADRFADNIVKLIRGE